MATINLTLRSVKGSQLTSAEADANFTNIKDAINAVEAKAGVSTVNGRSGDIVLTSRDITTALGFTPSSGGGSTAGVTTFNSRSGAVTLTSGDITGALGYTPATSAAQAAGSIGQIAYFPVSSAPSGWLICDGSAVSRTTYSLLFALIGVTYGSGDGSTTFNVPDLRGEFIRSLDLSRGVDAGRTIGSYQAAGIGSHAHGFQHVSPYANGLVWATGDDPGGNTSQIIDIAGGAETRPRNIALLACICALPISVSGYTLPTASASGLGGVKVGSGLSIDGSGVLSAAIPQSNVAAWVQYNARTQTIVGSYNIASVTHLSIGHLRVNFTTAMPSAAYAAIAIVGGNNSDNTTSWDTDAANNRGAFVGACGTTSFDVRTVWGSSGSYADFDYVNIVVVR